MNSKPLCRVTRPSLAMDLEERAAFFSLRPWRLFGHIFVATKFNIRFLYHAFIWVQVLSRIPQKAIKRIDFPGRTDGMGIRGISFSF